MAASKPSRGGVGVGRQVLDNGGRTQPRVLPSTKRAQPSVSPSTSNPNPGRVVSHQFNPIGAVTGFFSRAAHAAENAIFGNPAERAAAQQRVHDVTSPQTKVITPGWSNTGRIDQLSGRPIGTWAFNQDNSAGRYANIHENDDMRDEYGNPLKKATGFRVKPGEVFPYTDMNGVTMNVTIDDFKKEKGTNEWDDFKPVKSTIPAVTKIIHPFGANTNYQLGTQGVVGGSGSYHLGSSLTANNPAVSGRASGALTQGGWTQGAASGGSSGGPSGTANFVNNGGGVSASGLSGISSDRGRR